MNNLHIKLVNLLLICALTIFPAHADNPPAIDFESIMNGYFDDSSGLISFGDYRIAFAPEGQFNGLVAVLNAKGEIVA